MSFYRVHQDSTESYTGKSESLKIDRYNQIVMQGFERFFFRVVSIDYGKACFMGKLDVNYVNP